MADIIKARIPDTIIGPGAIKSLGDIAKSFSPNKILIITDAGLVKVGIIDAIRWPLEHAPLSFDVFDGCKEKPPISMLEKLNQKVKSGNYSLLIGVGGGSVMDSTKIVSVIANNNISVLDYVGTRFPALVKGKIIPKILIPTTAGTGSEWSEAAVAYDDDPGDRSYPCNSDDNIADKVIIDPELTMSVPQRVTADTGIDALSHAIEAYTSGTANLYSDMFTSTAIRLIAENIRPAYAKGCQNTKARYNMSVAAAFAMGGALASGPGLVHFLGDAIKAKVSHGTICTILLPPVMEFNLPSNPAKFASLAKILGEQVDGLSILDAAAKSIDSVRSMIKDLELPQRLRDIGIKEADIADLAKKADAINHDVIALLNPRDANLKDIEHILHTAL